jgi:hypothetical protein
VRASAGTLEDGKHVASYGKKSGTGVMRKHLFSRHRNEWVKACDDLKIKITAKDAQKHVESYRREQGTTPVQADNQNQKAEIPKFTQDTFIDALVDFIVADDQVCNEITALFLPKL